MQGFAPQLNSTAKHLLSGASLLEAFWVRAAWWKTHFTPAAAMPTCKMHSSNLKGKMCSSSIADLSSRPQVLGFHRFLWPWNHHWGTVGMVIFGQPIFNDSHCFEEGPPRLFFLGLMRPACNPTGVPTSIPNIPNIPHATHRDSHLFVGEQQLQLLMPDFCGPANARFRGHCDDIVSLKIQCNHQSTKSDRKSVV